jgi:hypothetical protein
MGTVLSLPKRAFLALLGALLAFACLPTRAEELQFDLTATAIQVLPGPNTVVVGPVNISFLLDTLSDSPSLVLANNPDGTMFVQSLRSGGRDLHLYRGCARCAPARGPVGHE